MAQLCPSTTFHRSQSPVSLATSDTTYHSFYDVELFEPASPVATIRRPSQKVERFEHEPKPISRHDSGYESAYSKSSYSHNNATRSSQDGPRTRRQTRPSMQRAAKSTPSISYPRRMSGQSLHSPMPQPHQQPNTYYYFPSPEAITGTEQVEPEPEQVFHPPPPQTTHYWTSDHTRRLEYAAIDNASRGVKGWVMKHVVPDCFVPKDHRRLTFDDDTGSVRRYRLQLEYDDSEMREEKAKRGRKPFGWLFRRRATREKRNE
ncbi:hypothetical protein F4808DRAFT_261837 [Astrocystis sublimbata]|nr:hypothetical protein F4808DRAFT_261837 [Astrocystis sublimbata]